MKVTFNDAAYEQFVADSFTPLSESHPKQYRNLGPEKAKLHDAGFSFLKSALSKLDPTVYKPKRFITYGMDLDVEEGGGIVEFIEYFTADWSGIADEVNNVFGNQANYVPRINAGLVQNTIPVYTFEIAYDLRFIDLEKIAKQSLPQSVESVYKDTILAAFDLFVNRIAYLGAKGNDGLFTSSKVVPQSLPVGGSDAELSAMSDAEVLALMNGMLAEYIEDGRFNVDLLPDTILVPTQLGKALQRHSELFTQNLRNYFAKNNYVTDEAEAHDLKDFTLHIRTRSQLDDLGLYGTGRVVMYRKSAEFVKIWIPYPIKPYQTSVINIERMAYTTLFVGQVSAVQMPYNDGSDFGAVTYWDFLDETPVEETTEETTVETT